jgi:2-C-methyl-D-erythritol 4-phosphate cytidylyltransferase/2-C-methyl-D-erythritol 2,4-cyclodiphosphate synthase
MFFAAGGADAMTTAALIVAGGRGSRAGDGPPKQYRAIAGVSVIARTLALFDAAPLVERLCVVLGAGDRALFEAATAGLTLKTPLMLATGGAHRAESVRKGLEALAGLAADAPERVLIHDAARPFTAPAVIDAVIAALADAPGACASAPVVDTLRREEDGACGPVTPREGMWRAQTPQGFRFADILAAHRAHGDAGATDDAEIARRAGLRVALVESDEDNFKITRVADFARAERLLAAREGTMLETRMGVGFDVHRFGAGDHVMLCGVRVPHDRGFVAHSDGDVALHALTDAVMGALALGDIGRWFPPSDPQWKGAASDQFLAKAVALCAERGFRPVALDVTIICERPKIGPHAEAMRARIAEIAGVGVERVSVKATTSEGLGFTGRGEGIAAQAAATFAGPAGAGA